MKRKNVTVLTALDLSAAFDTVDHSVLLTTLQSNFEIHGTALNWIKYYLAPRNMKIIIGNTYSDEKDLTLNSTYNEVAFNKKMAIMKENLQTNISHSPIRMSHLMKSCL